MPLDLTAGAPEQGTYVITVSLTDEDGTGLTPTDLTWTLMNLDGQLINDRKESTFDNALSSANDIVLSTNDLALSDPNKPVRVILVEGTYTSSYGVGLPLKEQCKFSIKDLVGVT